MQLQVVPATRAFTCRHVFTLPATDTAPVIQLNLDKRFRVQNLRSPGGVARRGRGYYSNFQDALPQPTVRYPWPG
ncbi:hypothetical protein QMK33_15370 [Hymenobacter sp. H14-R3]|uniref:hypothetical protein n=1 Tax=Hymenobacter sp. H14-R3 TaxID=3046308 RepID=UPI0024BA587B|nr:hypothetical protein [Hymenobacter sp. H14-R3]MDJ0366538.1 hypothetical protein [Hymenobacter sp. H14-R3]